jgi:methyltransferase-like protein/cyclopropane fatty-acyl-phospholipid synthase-like methyltransferase
MDLLSTEQATSYDIVPYLSKPYAQSHPDRLATIATLAGLRPVPVVSSRVLELGCAAGGNLIPMALELPGSTFLGIDLSAKQVDEGRKTIADLGLKNIELIRKDIKEVGPETDSFDYIIVHGVFSWVPREVQDKILEVCSTHLAPDGVVYLSYNTLPGWHTRGVVRDLMTYHSRQFHDPRDKVGQAKALLEFVVRALEGQQTPYANLLRDELKLVQQVSDWYIYHDHLEDENHPLYFHEFVTRASAYGLRYLGEAEAHTMAPRSFAPAVQEVLQRISPDILRLEQYMDFLRNRMFRQTLLCHGALTPNYQLTPAHAHQFSVASRLRPASATPNIKSDAEERYLGPGDIVLTTRAPVVKATVTSLAQWWPTPFPFQALCEAVAERLGLGVGNAERVQDAVGTWVLGSYTSSNILELSVTPPSFTATPGEKPVASPLARRQAQTSKVVTNLRHEQLTLGDAERFMVTVLDGTMDRPTLTERLGELVDKGVLTARQNDQPVTDKELARKVVAESVDPLIQSLARSALLTA